MVGVEPTTSCLSDRSPQKLKSGRRFQLCPQLINITQIQMPNWANPATCCDFFVFPARCKSTLSIFYKRRSSRASSPACLLNFLKYCLGVSLNCLLLLRQIYLVYYIT